MTTIADLYGLCSASSTVRIGGLVQEELDILGGMLDRLEEIEIFLDSDCTTDDRKDAEAEFAGLTDMIDALVERI